MKSIYFACMTLLILSLHFSAGVLFAADGANIQTANRILHVCSSGIRNNACDQTSKGSAGSAAGRSASMSDSVQIETNYLSNVEGKIAAFFVLSRGFYKDLSAIVAFKISRDGNIYWKSLEKKSGNYNFDMAALQAVAAAAPFGQPPRELTGVEIRVTFHP